MFGIGFKSSLNQLFLSEFVIQIRIVVQNQFQRLRIPTKSLNAIKRDREYVKSDRILTFSKFINYIWHFLPLIDLFWSLNQLFWSFDQNRSILIKFNWKEIQFNGKEIEFNLNKIKNRSNSRSTIQFWHWNLNCCYIAVWIPMAWNLNCWQFEFATLNAYT